MGGAAADDSGGRAGSLAAVRRSYLTLAAVCTFWGTIPLIVRRVDVDASVIVAVRLWVAAIGLGIAVAAENRLLRTRTAGRGQAVSLPPRLYAVHPVLCVAAAAVLAVHWLSLFAAYKRASAGTVILIVYLAPIVVAGAAPHVLGETVGRRTLGALALALGGFVLVAAPAAEGASAAGVVLALIAAVTFAALVLASKPLSEAYGGLRTAFMEMTGAGLVLVPVAIGARWGDPSASWAWLVVLGVAHTAVATGIYLAVLGRLPATHVSILGYLEPASVVLFGWLFLSQTPSLSTVVGGVLIVAAGALVFRSGMETAVVAEVPVGAGS